mmetsp:Transcript_2448/g.6579  ORF Transcript_2448/g.6579 Transcript_2448/m.6579 type:complete len:282 (+) Transcript_2448:12-857(+)
MGAVQVSLWLSVAILVSLVSAQDRECWKATLSITGFCSEWVPKEVKFCAFDQAGAQAIADVVSQNVSSIDVASCFSWLSSTCAAVGGTSPLANSVPPSTSNGSSTGTSAGSSATNGSNSTNSTNSTNGSNSSNAAAASAQEEGCLCCFFRHTALWGNCASDDDCLFLAVNEQFCYKSCPIYFRAICESPTNPESLCHDTEIYGLSNKSTLPTDVTTDNHNPMFASELNRNCLSVPDQFNCSAIWEEGIIKGLSFEFVILIVVMLFGLCCGLFIDCAKMKKD